MKRSATVIRIELNQPLETARRTLDEAYVTAALARTEGNVQAAAELAGVDRVTFYRLLRRCGLRINRAPVVERIEKGGAA